MEKERRGGWGSVPNDAARGSGEGLERFRQPIRSLLWPLNERIGGRR